MEAILDYATKAMKTKNPADSHVIVGFLILNNMHKPNTRTSSFLLVVSVFSYMENHRSYVVLESLIFLVSLNTHVISLFKLTQLVPSPRYPRQAEREMTAVLGGRGLWNKIDTYGALLSDRRNCACSQRCRQVFGPREELSAVEW